MLVAVIAAVIAALVVASLVVGFFYLRSRRSTHAVSNTKSVQQLNTVGVGSSAESRGSRKGAPESEVTVGSSEAVASAKPADGLTRRYFALGGLATLIFGVLGVKLFSMQIIGGAEYANAAEDQIYTTVNTPAPRGFIYDSKGEPLVINRSSQTVLARADVAQDRDVVRRLSTVLGLPPNVIIQRISNAQAGAQSLRTVTDDARLRDVAFIAEHADAFPGVSVETRTKRVYPHGALAAHALGYTGSPSEESLESQPDGRNILPIDTVGKSGVEATYDSLLSGEHGEQQIMVDAYGDIISVVSETQATKGSDIYLTIDSQAQYVADKALAELIAPYGVIGTATGTSGAIVGLDVRDGSVLVMSSYPTFDPANFIGAIPTDIWETYQDEGAYEPLNNRVVNGQYAAASTFKAFSSMAGLEYGYASEGTTWTCTGEWDGFGSGDVQKCWDHDGHGTLDLHGGIVHSCDVVFYEIAKAFYRHGPAGKGEISETALQDYYRKYGFGEATGIDLANESVGRVPTPEWKAEQWRNLPSEAVWRGGDYTNMIIGQGDVLVTPLQLACAYGGIATGKIMRPHLLKEVHNSDDDTVIAYEPEVMREPDVNEHHLEYVRESLHDMIREGENVSKVFAEANVDAAGKSGTAERSNENDTAWFVAYAPYNDPKYVVACVIDQGGGGSDTAAPVVAKVLGELMKSQEGKSDTKVGYVSGSTGQSVELALSSGSRTD